MTFTKPYSWPSSKASSLGVASRKSATVFTLLCVPVPAATPSAWRCSKGFELASKISKWFVYTFSSRYFFLCFIAFNVDKSTMKVLNQTYDHRMRVLRSVAKELPNWTVMVKKMKAIYHTMNLFNMDVSKKCLIGECWVPMADLQIVQNCLTEGSVSVKN